MIPYRELLRICEGNKRLARSTQAFIKNQETISDRQWREKIRPLMIQAEKDIVKELKDIDVTAWQTSNLNNILDQIQNIIKRLDGQFKAEQPKANKELIDFATSFADKNAKQIGISFALEPQLTDDILLSLIPLSDVFISNFTDDMAKILRSEISLGMINGLSTNEVARNIRDKFKSSNMSLSRARRIAQTEMLRSASLAQAIRARQIAKTNPDLKKSWINSHRPMARKTHIAVETRTAEKPIPYNKEFSVGGEKAMYPRDPQLSAKNTVYCGCTMILVTPETEDAPKEVTKKVKKSGNK